MATELIQYIGDKGLTQYEAAALLAGITLDTKNFVLKTGVRTFEAAAYLRQRGADTVIVKRLFSNSLDNYKAKYKLVTGAEIFDNCAVACSDDNNEEDLRVTAAQAADAAEDTSSQETAPEVIADPSAQHSCGQKRRFYTWTSNTEAESFWEKTFSYNAHDGMLSPLQKPRT